MTDPSCGDYKVPAVMVENSGTCPGPCIKSCLYVPINASRVTSKICEDISNIGDFAVSEQVMAFCDSLSQYLLYNNVTAELPEMYSSINEDEAYFEWIFDQFRFGFLFYNLSSAK